MKKRATVIIILVLCILAINYYTSSLARAVKDGEIRKTLNLSDGSKVIISESEQYIYGNKYKKGILGWRVTHVSGPAVRDRVHQPIEYVFTTSNISYLSVENLGVFYGYADPEYIDYIRIRVNNLDIKYKVYSHYWYIPIIFDDVDEGYINSVISVVLKDGSERLPWPFEDKE